MEHFRKINMPFKEKFMEDTYWAPHKDQLPVDQIQKYPCLGQQILPKFTGFLVKM